MKFSDDVRAEAAVAKPKEKKGWNQKKRKGKKIIPFDREGLGA